ncbi:MAG: hypothetical protein ACI4AM_09560, partial [Muribaculaceae bacterium]
GSVILIFVGATAAYLLLWIFAIFLQAVSGFRTYDIVSTHTKSRPQAGSSLFSPFFSPILAIFALILAIHVTACREILENILWSGGKSLT